LRRLRAGLAAAALVAACAFAREPRPAAEGITQADVDAALARGREALLQHLEQRGGYGRGESVLCVMALLNAGAKTDDPRVQVVLRRVLASADRFTDDYRASYEAGLVCMLLHMLKDPAHRRLTERMVSALMNAQKSDGGWGDNSRTQFALLGLKAAHDLGVPVPPDVFKRARRYVEAGQIKEDGSWGYTPGAGSGYGSMTAAGITSLFIINEQANKQNRVCGSAVDDTRIRTALDWLGGRFSVQTNPGTNSNHYYYLYALERIGVLTGQKLIGGHDWYREGAEYVLRHQGPDGSWRGRNTVDTAFALLFLGKGRDPVALQKLCYEGDWNTDPYDAKDLVELASRDLGAPMSCQVVNTAATAATLADAPILYIQGHGPVVFPAAFRTAVKLFVENGGFVVASACCGSPVFDQSFRAEMARVFPDAPFEPLPADHEVYTIRHRIASPQAFMLQGMNTGCRVAVLYAPHDLCCAWGACQGCTDKARVEEQEAKNVGLNIIAYALDYQKLKSKLEHASLTIRPAGETPARNAVLIGQLQHGGDWNPDPASLANLGKTLKEQAGSATDFIKQPVALGQDDLGNFPLLYLTGHRAFEFKPEQVEALRAYLERGGFLIADPCCGKDTFDAAFRRLCQQLYPARPLARLPKDHPVLRTPYAVETVAYTGAVAKQFPDLGDKPWIEGISGDDGRLRVFYSRMNFGCALQEHGCPHCVALGREDSYRVAVNAVLYALSH
jgi:hypothetical protein